MTRGRIASALYALVLAIAACGLAATHARTVPATGAGVVKVESNQERSADVIAEDSFGTGRALQAKSATPACVGGTDCGVDQDLGKLPYVPPNPLQLWRSHACPVPEPVQVVLARTRRALGCTQAQPGQGRLQPQIMHQLDLAPRFMPCRTVADSFELSISDMRGHHGVDVQHDVTVTTLQCAVRSPATPGDTDAHDPTIDHVAGRSRAAPSAAVSPAATTGSAEGPHIFASAHFPASSRPARPFPRTHRQWRRLSVAWSLCSSLIGPSSVVVRSHRIRTATALDVRNSFRTPAPFAQ